jgi:tripartite-type tricarboxylate transporter receptor subunit TctC
MSGNTPTRKNFSFTCGRLSSLLSLSILLLFVFLNVSGAADYPTKSIQMICPMPPGGGSDIAARIIANKVSFILGRSVVVVNKAGGGGVIGTYEALNAPPDGYTIANVSPTTAAAPLVTKGVTYTITKDLIPINVSVTGPMLIVVKKDSPWKTLDELIADAKKNPGKFSYGTSGNGSTLHFAGELFKIYTNTDINHVPMGGVAPALTALLGGHLSMVVPEFGAAYKYLQAGSLRALVTMAKTRHKDLSDVPTSVEKGLPNLIMSTWQSFGVPVKTPREIVDKLDAAFKAALNDKEVIETFEKTGWVVENLGSKEAAEFWKRDQQIKTEIAKKINLAPT